MPPFELSEYLDKSVLITGPGDLEFEIDYDDVNTDEIDGQIERMLAILNEHWDSSPSDAVV
jgi:hypothetical protein